MKTRFSYLLWAILISVSSLIAFIPAQSAENHRLLNLRGHWKFNLGDDTRWADPKFDDRDWSEVYVPSQWEEEGYPGYDGYAWYRKHFKASEGWQAKDLIIGLGMIDDVDEVYLNGKYIGGTGSFPPDYETAYNTERQYTIPASLLRTSGDNVIAVRVFDDHGPGGIVDGRVGIYERRYSIDADISFPTLWKFKTGDDLDWKEAAFDDNDWKEIRVPSYWETQGFKNYDGYAWYRVKFHVPSDYKGEDLIMLVGRIDDFDETYLNGRRIGRTGSMPKYKMSYTNSDEYKQMRAYMIPRDALKYGGENVLAVRVYDCWQGGGIYDGPVGLVTKDNYRSRNYRHSLRSVRGWFEDFFDDLFH